MNKYIKKVAQKMAPDNIIKVIKQNPFSKYSLKRMEGEDSFYIDRLPEEFYVEEEKKTLRKQKIDDEICEKFSHFLAKVSGEIDLSAFLVNIQNFSVKEKDIRSSYYEFDGKRSKIVYSKDAKASSLYHELFHMCSARALNERFYYGFMQYTKNETFSVGEGLTEGYTELLVEKFFNDEYDESISAYQAEINIARVVELLAGEENMRKLYFKSDLLSLVEILSTYASLNDALLLVRLTDTITSFRGEAVGLIAFNKFYNQIGKILNTMLRNKYPEISYLMKDIKPLDIGNYNVLSIMIDRYYGSKRAEK